MSVQLKKLPTSKQKPDIDNFTFDQLLMRLNNDLEAEFKSKFKGKTRIWVNILLTLDGKEMTMGELALKHGANSSAISTQVTRMEMASVVVRINGSDLGKDRRKVYIKLTGIGEAKLVSIRESMVDWNKMMAKVMATVPKSSLICALENIMELNSNT